MACHRRARLAADRHTPHDQTPAEAPAARLRVFCYRIDLCADPPEQPVAGHGLERAGQRCRKAELRSDGAWGQAGGVLRQDVEDQLPERFRGGRQVCLRRFLHSGLWLSWMHNVLVLLRWYVHPGQAVHLEGATDQSAF